MREIIIYGRAGQGAITTAEILGSALIKANKFVYAFPMFGAARMGAPMHAYLRYDDKPVRLRSQIKVADYAMILDDTLLAGYNLMENIKSNGIVVVNSKKNIQPPQDIDIKVFNIPANDISEKIASRVIVNTVLLGAFCDIIDDIEFDHLLQAIEERFEGKIAKINLELARAGYEYSKKCFQK